MHFEQPQWMILFALVPMVYYLYHFSAQKKKASAIKFSNIAFLKTAMNGKSVQNRSRVLFYLNMFILISVVFALSDPYIVLPHKGEGVNVVLALDVSGSMKAPDYTPSRMEAAKRAAWIFVESLLPTDRAGVVIFSEGATTQSFMIKSRDRTLANIASINVQEGRTAIGDGLALAIDMVTSVESKKKVVILLSDGVNNAGIVSPQEAVGFAKAQDIKVYTVGMGSNGNVQLGVDWFGRPVYAEFDEATLQMIASETGGEYFKSVDDKTLDTIYKSLSEKIERKDQETSTRVWFVMLAFMLVVLEFYLRYVRYRILS
ncbi:MAG: VWA domain-containing protein [archaeon]